LTGAASVVVVGDRENDIYSCFARRPEGIDLIVRAAQDRATKRAGEELDEDASPFARAAAWPRHSGDLCFREAAHPADR
jgi:hypothetical protein